MRSIFLLLGALGGVAPAFAQSAVTPNPSPSYEETLLVTASSIAVEAEETPSTATVITASEVEARQVTSLVDLLATVPGLQMVTSGAPGQVSSAFVRGAESDQVLLLWNGVPLNNPDFGAINWSFVTTDGVERVEVVRGPFSSLWGGSAVGGVVQVLTKPRTGVRLHLEGGADSYRRGGLAAAWNGDRVGLEVAGSHRRGDSEFDHGFFDSDQLSGGVSWRPVDSVQLGANLRWDESDTGIPFAGGQPAIGRTIAWEDFLIAVPFAWQGGAWSLDGRLSSRTLDNTFDNPLDPFGFTGSTSETEDRGGRAVLRHSGEGAFSFAAGGETERREATTASSFGAGLQEADQSTWAVFGEVGYLAGPLRVEAGLRRDDNDAFGGETSLRTALAWRIADPVRVRFSYGEAFRPPTLGDLFFPGSGNPDLQPERSESFELAVEGDFGPWLVSATAFSSEQDELIDFDFTTFRNVNVGQARSRGVELGLAYRSDRLTVRADGTYLDAEDRDQDLPLLRRAERTASAVAIYRPGDWTFTLSGRYVGDRPDLDPVTFQRADNPSYSRIDLAAAWRLRSWITPAVRIENVTDESYQEALGFPAQGRLGFVGVRLSL